MPRQAAERPSSLPEGGHSNAAFCRSPRSMLTASFAESMRTVHLDGLGARADVDRGKRASGARTLDGIPRTPAAFRAGALELGEQIAGNYCRPLHKIVTTIRPRSPLGTPLVLQRSPARACYR